MKTPSIFTALSSLGFFCVLAIPVLAEQISAVQVPAEQWMAKAVEASQSVEDPSAISHAAAQFARVHARLGQVDAAFEASKRVSNPQLKLYALKATLQSAIDAERGTGAIVDEATQTLLGNEGAFNNMTMAEILRIADAKQKTESELAFQSPPQPSIEQLLSSFETAETREAKLAAFEPLAFQLLQSKSYERLERVIEEAVEVISLDPLPDHSSKFGTYGDLAAIARVRGMHLHLALSLVEQDQLDKAAKQLALVDALIDELPEQSALVKWPLQELRIRVLLALGRTQVAISQLDAIKAPMIVSRAAAAIAAHEIGSNRIESGLKVAERIGNEPGSGAARGTVAIALFELENHDDAIHYVRQLGESDEAMNAIIALARHWVERKDAEQLRSSFDSLLSPVARTHYAIAAAEFLKLGKP